VSVGTRPPAGASRLRSPNAVALALIAGAALLYVAWARPLESRAAAAADEFRKARQERHAAEARLALARRRVSALDAAGGAPSDPPALRRSVVRLLEHSRLSSVRLVVRPDRPPVTARVSLFADGAFADLVQLSGRLVRPGTGLVLERLRLAPRSSALGMDVEAVSLGVER
jgi:hypothetical protein